MRSFVNGAWAVGFVFGFGMCVVLFGAGPANASAQTASPSVLVCSSRGTGSRYVDLTWLTELKAKGFEPDYLAKREPFTWDRIRQYNVLILYGTPPAEKGAETHVWGPQAPRRDEFITLIQRYLDAGGGVYYMEHTRNADWYSYPLMKQWDARLPWAYYRESDEAKRGLMPRMGTRGEMAMTEQIEPSPISDGVSRLWFPVFREGNSTRTGPLKVGGAWQVVVRGSRTSYMEPVNPKKLGHRTPPHPNPYVIGDNIDSPPLAAIRDYKQGRIFLTCQSPQFSIGQGTKWLYQRVCLSQGLDGKPSDMARLTANALRWLAQPSMTSKQLGGFETPKNRLKPTNLKPATRQKFEDRWSSAAHQPSGERLHKGLIGARSRLSSGSASVKRMAEAARRAGLDWVVFIEKFTDLDRSELRKLDELCRRYSDDDLLLLPGYGIETNTNNHMFFYGYDLPWPEPYCLTGENDELLNLQHQNAQGEYVSNAKTWGTWLMKQHNKKNADAPLHNIGFYDFTDTTGVQLPDARGYSAGAIRFYKHGELVEDRTNSFLTTAAGTTPPVPVAVNLIESAGQLRRQVRAEQGLTYAQAGSPNTLMEDALHYAHTFAAPNVFTSTGPMIRAWPALERTMTFGGERFVASRNLMRARLHVTSNSGLKKVTIYNGRRVLRRFRPDGAETFNTTLHLPTNVQRTMIVVAKDVEGGKAVSYSRRTWKFEHNVRCSFCGDRQNECSSAPRLSKGPGNFLSHRIPEMPQIVAGITWDGGPKGIHPIATFYKTTPTLEGSAGREPHGYFNNLPLLESGDAQATVVRSVLNETYHSKIPPGVLGHWPTRSWGPIVPTKLVKSVRRFVQYNRPNVRVQPLGKPHWGVNTGAYAACYDNRITFKKAQTVNQLRLFNSRSLRRTPVMVSYKGDDEIVTRELTGRDNTLQLRLQKGDWVGFFSPTTTNDVIFINRGHPVRVLKGTADAPSRHIYFAAAISGEKVEKGETRRYSFFSVTDPLDAPRNGADRFQQILDYLERPTGLSVQRGEAMDSIGYTDVRADNGAVEISVPRPDQRTDLTIPVRIHGLNPNWSAGIYQIDGHTAGYYTDGERVYSPIGFDFKGRVYAALFPDLHETTHVVAGHPVVASDDRIKLEVMPRPRGDGHGPPYDWHVAANNPTDEPITATFRQAMNVTGLDLNTQRHTLAPGGHKALIE